MGSEYAKSVLKKFMRHGSRTSYSEGEFSLTFEKRFHKFSV